MQSMCDINDGSPPAWCKSSRRRKPSRTRQRAQGLRRTSPPEGSRPCLRHTGATPTSDLQRRTQHTFMKCYEQITGHFVTAAAKLLNIAITDDGITSLRRAIRYELTKPWPLSGRPHLGYQTATGERCKQNVIHLLTP